MRIATSATRIHSKASVSPLAHPVDGLGFDWTLALLSSLLLAGVTLDIWAHNHGRTDNTFFTPWHGLLYGMLAVTGIFLSGSALWNHARGYVWRRSLPRGYGMSLLGVALFLAGGIFDLIWHSLFGFEADIETLLSPAHLLLALAGILIATGPLRSTWRRYPASQTHGWAALGPAIISTTLVFSVLTLFTQYAHPFVETAAEASGSSPAFASVSIDAAAVSPPFALSQRSFTVRPESHITNLRAHLGGTAGSYGNASPSRSISSILIQTAIMMGAVLLLVRRWQLPFGALLFMLTVNGMVMLVQADQYRLLPAILISGLVGDLLISHLRPSLAAPGRLYLFAFALPVVLYASYFALLFRDRGIAWSTHLWSGSILLAGIVGLLLSFLLAPPLESPEADSDF